MPQGIGAATYEAEEEEEKTELYTPPPVCTTISTTTAAITTTTRRPPTDLDAAFSQIREDLIGRLDPISTPFGPKPLVCELDCQDRFALMLAFSIEFGVDENGSILIAFVPHAIKSP